MEGMGHPFAGDLSEFTVEELQEKVDKINQQRIFAHRMNNMDAMRQLEMLGNSYRKELNSRMDEMMAKHNMTNYIKIEDRRK
jgi:hypothetical protein